MLGYILFGDRFRDFKREANRSAEGIFSKCRGGRYGRSHFSTGNVAFDDWRKAELDRMEEERRRLDEMRAEFDSYLRELRRAKDQEEFDRFMRERANARKDDGAASGYSGRLTAPWHYRGQQPAPLRVPVFFVERKTLESARKRPCFPS